VRCISFYWSHLVRSCVCRSTGNSVRWWSEGVWASASKITTTFCSRCLPAVSGMSYYLFLLYIFISNWFSFPGVPSLSRSSKGKPLRIVRRSFFTGLMPSLSPNEVSKQWRDWEHEHQPGKIIYWTLSFLWCTNLFLMTWMPLNLHNSPVSLPRYVLLNANICLYNICLPCCVNNAE